MKVLMFGWEFPPFNRGGLGTACEGLVKALDRNDINVIFVLPRGKNYRKSNYQILVADNIKLKSSKVKFHYVDSLLHPYMTSKEYSSEYNYLSKEDSEKNSDMYGQDLFLEVSRYAEKAALIAEFEEFDCIHAHDWMCYGAGIAAKKVSGKPLVIHVHATDFDRTGGNPNQYIYDKEREGMHAADQVIAVSNFTKNTIVEHYGLPEHRVKVVHNSIEAQEKPVDHSMTSDENIVLFLGRLTIQKGPDYFLEAAAKVLDFVPDTKFVVAGSGDMYGSMIEKAAQMGIGKNVLFTGHLKGDDVDKAYQMAKLYVMPSISEPFGLTPLESIRNGTPVIISKQSGVSEILVNALKIDFWDVEELTNKIVSVLKYNNLQTSLMKNGLSEVNHMTWDKAARECIDIYNKVMHDA